MSVNFWEPVSRNWSLRVRLASTSALRCRNSPEAYCTSSMMTGGGALKEAARLLLGLLGFGGQIEGDQGVTWEQAQKG